MPMKRRWPPGLAVLSLMMICAGCAAAPEVPKPAPVHLPQTPDWLAPVKKPQLKVGMDARVALARTDAALDLANGRLGQGRGWYDGVRADFEGVW